MTTTTNALDGLLYIRNGYASARWNFPDAVGSPVSSPGGVGHSVSLTYSFPAATPAYFSESTFLAFDGTQKQATRAVLSSIGEVAGVNFVEVSGVGQMTFAMSSQHSGQGGYAYTPSYSYSYSGTTIASVTEQGIAGDVWLNRNAVWDAEDWLPGHSAHATLVHEIGHALGLKHPFESTSSGYTLVSSLDNESHTVMSYTMAPHSRLISVSGTAMSYSWQETFLRPSTLMPLDIAALQYLYGANTSTRTANDVYHWSPNAELLETIWDAGGVDSIDCSNQTLTCLIDLRAGHTSSIAFRQTDAELRLGLDLPSWFTQALPADIYNGSNNLVIATGVVIEKAYGGTGNDQITGNDANNTLNGGGGADSIAGGLGNDSIDGGAGMDTMVGGDGNDTYYVRDTSDVVSETNATTSTGGTDIVYSTLAAYTLTANVENGRILSTTASNLSGNSGNNVLYAGAGNNVLNGGIGTDTVSYAYGLAGTTGVTVSLAVSTAQATGGSGSDTLLSIENLIGSAYADRLTGNTGANSLSGAAGNDTLDGGTGIDTMAGGDGSDGYYVRDSGDIVSETNATTSTGGTDIVYSTLAAYTLTANVENGRILSTTAANLSGNSGNNVLYAGAGNNVLNGGTGTDTVSYAYGLAGTTGVTVSLAVSTAQATGGSGSDTLLSIENLIGSAYADRLTGNTGANSLSGAAGNDTLDGGTGIDTMAGGDGSDGYYVRDSGDIVSETNATTSTGGTDTVYSTLAAYTLTANVENGRILSTTAANLTGNTLNNVLYAGAGNNVLDGGTGTDTVSYAYAAAGVTVSLASSLAQSTVGSGSDTLLNIENLTGGNFNDHLAGNGGNNTLTGGLGMDVLTGNGGNDLFDFNALSEMGLTSTTWDVITDFVHGPDKIDLSTLDADTAFAGNQAFTAPVVGGTFSGVFASAGDLYFDNAAHVLYGNTDADAAAEFAIQLVGVSTLTAADLFL
jgi:Ca2+-binding RTX toxin-like protein